MALVSVDLSNEQIKNYEYVATVEGITSEALIHDIIVFYCDRKYKEILLKKITDIFEDLSPNELKAKLEKIQET